MSSWCSGMVVCAFWLAVWFLWDSGGCRWLANTLLRIGVLEAQDGVVVGVSGSSLPLRILNEHFRL